MSRQKKTKSLDRTIVKSFIQRYYGTYKDFCKAVKINHGSFSSYMLGIDTMPAIDRAVRKAMQAHDYPVEFAEDPPYLASCDHKQVCLNCLHTRAGLCADYSPCLSL